MGGLGEVLRKFFFGGPREGKPTATADTRTVRTRATGAPAKDMSKTSSSMGRSRRSSIEPAAPNQPNVVILEPKPGRAPLPYWLLRRWRRVADNMYLGYFKTPLGRRHGVIKWNSEFNYGVYVHNVPEAILSGPHGGCFTEVKPGKFRVHFAQQPRDVNGLIFYVETVLMEAFRNEQTN